MDYCDVIYHMPTYNDVYGNNYSERARTDPVYTNFHFNKKIEAVQYNAAFASTGSERGSSRVELYCELG